MENMAADEAMKKRFKEAALLGAGILIGASPSSLVWAYVMFWR